MTWGRNYEEEGGKPFYAEVLPVSDNFLDFFGIEVTQGRGFSPSDNNTPYGTMIVNGKLIQDYPSLHVGSTMSGHSDKGDAEIVGVVKDFNFKPLQYPVSPMILYCWGSEPWRALCYSYVKMAPGANPKDVTDHIKKVIGELDPDMGGGSVKVEFLDKNIQRMYNSEASLGKLITMASIVALLITIIGILGLVFFETQFLRKEIAVRRVSGASVGDILKMINKKYLLMALVSFAVSAPLVYLIISAWRKNFAYQAPIPVWIFMAALLLIIVITFTVVTLQSWKAATANPVESLKNE